MNNDWIRADKETPKEGEYVMAFSVFMGVKYGIYHDGCLETRWSHGETEKWNTVLYWIPIPKITL